MSDKQVGEKETSGSEAADEGMPDETMFDPAFRHRPMEFQIQAARDRPWMIRLAQTRGVEPKQLEGKTMGELIAMTGEMNEQAPSFTPADVEAFPSVKEAFATIAGCLEVIRAGKMYEEQEKFYKGFRNAEIVTEEYARLPKVSILSARNAFQRQD